MADVETLTVTLPAALAAELRALVESRRYLSTSHAVAEALEDWRDKQRLRAERLQSIRARIRESLDDPRPSLSEEEVERHFAALAARNGVPAEGR